MISDDGDIARGLGFMVMWAAHLERQIDELLFQLSPLQPFTEKEQKYSVSKKIAKAEKILLKHNNSFASTIISDLQSCKEHFEWRNELVHGRIYSPEYHADNLKSGRPNIPDRLVTSEELYRLANSLELLTRRLFWPISLPNFVAETISKRE